MSGVFDPAVFDSAIYDTGASAAGSPRKALRFIPIGTEPSPLRDDEDALDLLEIT